MTNRLFKKTGIYFIGNFSSRVISALIVPIYAIFVSSADLGEYDYLLTLTQILAPIAYLAIWEAILKFGITQEKNVNCVIATVIRFCIPLAIITFIIISCISYLLAFPITNIFFLGIMIFAYALARIWQYSSRCLGNTKEYAWSGVISSFVFFTCVIVSVCIIQTGLLGLCVAYVLGQLSIVVYLETRCSLLTRTRKVKFDPTLLKAMLCYSVPCIFNLVALNLLVGFGRIVTINLLGSEANGQYAFSMKFATIVTSIGSIFSMAVIEEGIIRSGSSKLSEFYSIVTNSLLILLCSVISVLQPCIYLFYISIPTSDYIEGVGLTSGVLFYAALTVMSTQFGSVFMAVNKTRSIATTTVLGLLVTMVLTLCFIESIGLLGVIIGLCGGTAVMTIARCFFAKKFLEFSFSYLKTIMLLCAYAAESFVCSFLYNNGYFVLLILVTCLIFIVYIPIFFNAINRMKRMSDYEVI